MTAVSHVFGFCVVWVCLCLVGGRKKRSSLLSYRGLEREKVSNWGNKHIFRRGESHGVSFFRGPPRKMASLYRQKQKGSIPTWNLQKKAGSFG